MYFDSNYYKPHELRVRDKATILELPYGCEDIVSDYDGPVLWIDRPADLWDSELFSKYEYHGEYRDFHFEAETFNKMPHIDLDAGHYTAATVKYFARKELHPAEVVG